MDEQGSTPGRSRYLSFPPKRPNWFRIPPSPLPNGNRNSSLLITTCEAFLHSPTISDAISSLDDIGHVGLAFDPKYVTCRRCNGLNN